MEMKINFDQLFGSQHIHNQANTTLESPSIQLTQSFEQSLNQSIDYKYTFDKKLFDFKEQSQQYYDQPTDQYSDIVRTNKGFNSTKTVVSQSSYKSQPGQRLYYESKQSELRKIKERQKIHETQQAVLAKATTFAPNINQNSRKIAQRAKEQKRETKLKKQVQSKTTAQKNEEKLLKECTFQPKLIAKNKAKSTKSQEELFYYLHNAAKIKDLKINQLIEEDNKQFEKVTKRGTQQDVSQFLKRNEQYSALVRKKQILLKQNTQTYDLKTGEKLFSPKISQHKAFNFHATASAKNLQRKSSQLNIDSRFNQETSINSKPQQASQKQRSNLFNKKYDNFQSKKTNQFNRQFNVQNNSSRSRPSENEVDMERRYRQYAQDYERRSSLIKQGSLQSKHPVIHQEQEHSAKEDQPSEGERVAGEHFEDQSDSSGYFNVNQQKEDGNLWNSKQEMRGIDVSNVKQFLTQSDEEEPQQRNNYVMDILNTLIVKEEKN